MYDRYAGPRGFTGEDILNTVNDVCACDLQEFFQAHVSGSRPLDFARHLALAGWRLDTATAPAADSGGRALPDLRASVTAFGGIGSAGGAAGFRPRLSIPDPTGAWARAGLLTGDEIVSVNGRPVAGADDFRAATSGVRVGDTVRVVYVRNGAQRTAAVPLAGYQLTRVRIVDLPSVTARQRAVRQAWLRGPEAARR
jgi:predicted metalloprotease with PDZ domain